MFSVILHKVIQVPKLQTPKSSHSNPYKIFGFTWSALPLSRFCFLAFYYSPTASGFTGLETSACPMIILSDVSHDNKLSRTKENFS